MDDNAALASEYNHHVDNHVVLGNYDNHHVDDHAGLIKRYRPKILSGM